MDLFERMLLLMVVAIILLQLSRRFDVPYPSLLAVAGCTAGALGAAPAIAIDPSLALALFIAPALLNSAYDVAPRELLRHGAALFALAVVAVVLTTITVAWLGVSWGRLSWPAALTLGAIVAPPDVVASAAVFRRYPLPRGTLTLLEGEGLLNDAVALLIFSTAVSLTLADAHRVGGALFELALAVPGGALIGWLAGFAHSRFAARVAGTHSAMMLEFVLTLGVWEIAERLHASAILAVVAFAMTTATHSPARQTPRDRVHSESVWQSTVFVLNVTAFLLMGLQVRRIVAELPAGDAARSFGFALAVLFAVIAVRMIWVSSYAAWARRRFGKAVEGTALQSIPTPRVALIVGWSGMRGLVTLATAFALPQNFPQRDLIALCAFTVVIGTLTLQGFTLGTLIRLLRIKPDTSIEDEMAEARELMLAAGLTALDDDDSPEASAVRDEYQSARALFQRDPSAAQTTDHNVHRLAALSAQRSVLLDLRSQGKIDDDVFASLQRELDWSELAAVPTPHREMHSL